MSVNRELLVARILSGVTRISCDDRVFVLKSPSAMQKYIAEEYYEDCLEKYHLEGFYTDEEYNYFLLEHNIWSEDRENALAKMKTVLEDLKVKLYEAEFKSNSRAKTRKELNFFKNRQEELIAQKNSQIHMSAKGLAGIAKLRYTIGISLFSEDGSRIFSEASYWNCADNGLLDRVVARYNTIRIGESDFRELARNEPWRSYWACRKASSGLFGTSASEMTDEQRTLVSWSLLYDSIYENPQCPSDEVIDEDDALDGFLIKETRNRERDKMKDAVESRLSDKMKEADEVFLVAETPEDAKKINELNSDYVKAVKRRRQELIQKKGLVEEQHMPDVKQRLMMEINNAAHEAVKNRNKI